jgi:L-fuconolactonase
MIDAHFHVWRIARGDYGWLRANSPLYRDYGLGDYRAALPWVSGAILVQAAPTEDETRFMLEVARASGGLVRGVVGWVELEAADAAARMDALADPLFVGIRPMLQDIEDTGWIMQPRVIAALRAAAERGLRLDALVLPRHLGMLRELAPALGAMRVVIDHGAKPAIVRAAFTSWAEGMTWLARETGWYCKLSGLATEAGLNWTPEVLRPYVNHLLRSFGPERLMWGSDWPVVTLASSGARWREVALRLVPAADHAAVFGGTAERFYLG